MQCCVFLLCIFFWNSFFTTLSSSFMHLIFTLVHLNFSYVKHLDNFNISTLKTQPLFRSAVKDVKSEFPFYAEPLRVYGNLFLMKLRRRLSSVWPFQKNSKDKWERVWKLWNQTDHKFIKRYVNYQQLNKLLYVEAEATCLIVNDWLVKLKHVVSVRPIKCVLLVPCSAKKLLENLAFYHKMSPWW